MAVPKDVKVITNSYATRNKKFTNSGFMGSGGLGVGDRGGNQFISQMDSNPHNSNDYVYRWRSYAQIYETSWEARKIIRIPVEDALRKPWFIEGLDEQVAKKIENKLSQLRGLEVLKRSLMLERLLGGCLTFLGLEGEEDNPSSPYKPREGQELRFMNSIPISRIARLEWDTNPLSEHYMRPHVYSINGTEIHVSRCLVWDGEPLFDPYDFILTNFRANLAGFGSSKLAPIWDDIIKAVGTRQAAYQMIQTNNSIIMAVQDIQDLAGTNPGKANLAKLKEIANNLSVYRAAIIDGEKVDISNTASNFGSVPDLLMTFLQVLSAASDIPATRFLGQAPGGLNATGESDLENYYNMIDAYQRQRVEPNLRRLYDIIGYNMFPNQWSTMRTDMKFNFPPLWNTKEGEQADVAGKRIDNALKLWQERAISDKKFIEEINAQGALSVTLDDVDIDLMGEFRDEQAEAMLADKSGGEGGGEAFGGGEQKGVTSPQNPNDVTKQLTRLNNIANGINPDEFEMGMNDEQDHLDIVDGDESKIQEIVRDHLREDPEYYSKLKKAGLLRTTDTARMLKQSDDISRHQNSSKEYEDGVQAAKEGDQSKPHAEWRRP